MDFLRDGDARAGLVKRLRDLEREDRLAKAVREAQAVERLQNYERMRALSLALRLQGQTSPAPLPGEDADQS